MFDRLGRGITRHPWIFLGFWLLVFVAAGVGALWGYGQGGLFDRMSNTQSLVAGSDSDEVNHLTAGGEESEGLTIVVTGLDLDAGLPQAGAVMAGQRTRLAAIDGVAQVVDPFALMAAPDPALQARAQALISQNRDGFLVSLSVDASRGKADVDATYDAIETAIDDLAAALRADFPDAAAAAVSSRHMSSAIIGQVGSDLVIGEAVSLPVALVLLVVVFGGIIAAGLPLASAIVSIIIGLGAVWGLTFLLDVDSFLLNVISIIGLALSIDYGLLVVARYREELAAQLAREGFPSDGSTLPGNRTCRSIVRQAVHTTVATAGRTVTFSAITIACAMSALMVMGSDMLRTVAIAGIVVTLLAVLMAIMVVPGLIVVAGKVLVRPSLLTRLPGIRTLTKAVGDSASDHGIFSRLAHRVHAHPWLIMGGALLILAVMASPIRDFTMRTVFADYLPPGHQTTTAYETIQRDYPAARMATIVVVAKTPPAETTGLYQHLGTLPEVTFVSPPAALPGDDSMTVINVNLDFADQVGTEVTDQVTALRQYGEGLDFDILVGGSAALQKDFIDSVVAAAPHALIIMALAVFVLLFLMTGSLVVPLKALIINSLSLVASLGTTSFIFQHGLFGMPKTLGIETFIAACAVAFGFGLAMDYEVFLLARIKEAWDAGLPNDEAVERGLQRSGRIITSAAAIIVAVFIGFTFGNMIAIKEIGVALAITVVTDATLVRLLLVPATMTVLGKWNWWAPGPLKAVYGKLGFLH